MLFATSRPSLVAFRISLVAGDLFVKFCKPESVRYLLRDSIGVRIREVTIAKIKTETIIYLPKSFLRIFRLSSFRFLNNKIPKKNRSPIPRPTKLDWEAVHKSPT